VGHLCLDRGRFAFSGFFIRQNRKKREIKTNEAQKSREQENFAGNAEILPFWMQKAVGGCGEVKFKESLNVSFA